jgi:hypothetical protein
MGIDSTAKRAKHAWRYGMDSKFTDEFFGQLHGCDLLVYAAR